MCYCHYCSRIMGQGLRGHNCTILAECRKSNELCRLAAVTYVWNAVIYFVFPAEPARTPPDGPREKARNARQRCWRWDTCHDREWVGCGDVMYGRSLATTDPRIPTMPRRKVHVRCTSGSHRTRQDILLAPSAKRNLRRWASHMEGKLQSYGSTKNVVRH